MKRKIILVIGLTMALTGCGNKEEAIETQPATEIKQEDKEKAENSTETIETEIVEFDANIEQFKDGLIVFYNTGDSYLYGLMDINGNVLMEPMYEYLAIGDEYILETEVSNNQEYVKHRYLNTDGHVVIEKVDGYEITDGEAFKDGYALVTLNKEEQKAHKYGDYCALIDKSGKIVVEAKEHSTYLTRQGDYIIEKASDFEIIKIYNLDGTPVDDSVYLEENYNNDNIFEINDLYIFKNLEDINYKSYGLYDNENKKELKAYDYNYYDPLRVGDNYIVVKLNEDGLSYFVLIDGKGKEIFNISEKYVGCYYPQVINDKIVISYPEEDTILLNSDGSVYKETEYGTLGTEDNEVQTYVVNSKTGFMKDFEKLTEPIYDGTRIDGDVAIGVRDGKLYRLEFK